MPFIVPVHTHLHPDTTLCQPSVRQTQTHGVYSQQWKVCDSLWARKEVYDIIPSYRGTFHDVSD